MRNVEAAENRRRGRPGRLTPALADQLVEQVAAGAGLGEAAQACGVPARSLRRWRRRAWSAGAADAPYVCLERRIVAALARARPVEATTTPWEKAAAALEREHPERWALPDLGDVLGELN
jgi:hypothetical protein